MGSSSVPHSLGFWKHSKEYLLSTLSGHTDRSNIQDERGRQLEPTRPYQAEHSHREQPTCFPLTPLGCPCSWHSRASTQGKSQLRRGALDLCLDGVKAGSPLPCSTMRAALCHTEVQGTSRQGKEAETSLDQVGTLSTSDQKDCPHLSISCLSSSVFALYFEFCIFSL